MFPFLKKNNNRNNNYYPNPNTYNNYQYTPDAYMNPYDNNMLDLELKELQREINHINMRLNRIEGYLGIREKSPSDY